MGVTRATVVCAAVVGLFALLPSEANAAELVGTSSTGNAVTATASGGATAGVRAISTTASAPGVWASSPQAAITGSTTGSSVDAIFGTTSSGSGWPYAGVHGQTGGSGIGVLGDTGTGNPANAAGVAGLTASGNNSSGVYGSASGPNNYGVFAYNSNSAGYGVYGQNGGGGYAVYANGNLGVSGIPKANQSTFSALSDIRLKKNVKPMAKALEQLLQLRGVTFEWKDPHQHGNENGTQRGFIAQDVEKVLPDWVSVDPDGLKRISIPGRGLEALLVESIRELKVQNDSLRDRVQALERMRNPVDTKFSSSIGAGVALGFLPVGMVAMLRRKRRLQGSP
jgi:hypothetical protein